MSDVTLRVCDVPVFLTEMFAPAIAAPEGSRTLPVIVAVAAWPKRFGTMQSANAKLSVNSFRNMLVPPLVKLTLARKY